MSARLPLRAKGPFGGRAPRIPHGILPWTSEIMTLNAVCSALHIAWRFAEVFTGCVSRIRLDGAYLQPNKRKHLVKACGFMRGVF
jgi:hypothetical protein